jgi:hypothetical protein
MMSMVMKLAKPKSGGSEVAGTLAIAAPRASYAVGFSDQAAKPANGALPLPPAAADCVWYYD